MTEPLRYGKRSVPQMIAEWDAHRKACRAEGTPAVQATLDAVEEHIDYAYRALPDPGAILAAALVADIANGPPLGTSMRRWIDAMMKRAAALRADGGGDA